MADLWDDDEEENLPSLRCELETCQRDIEGRPYTFTDLGNRIEKAFCGHVCCQVWKGANL